MPSTFIDPAMAEAVDSLRARSEPFAMATIVRTAGATAAKPGARALLAADGTVLQGWLGGGCTRGAVQKATVAAIAAGAPQLISVAPEEVLNEQGIAPGQEVGGVRFARNGCPSKGTIDIFIEPCLPQPELVVLGASPVARALARLAAEFDWDARVVEPGGALAPAPKGRLRATVVATQGQGDLAALEAALTTPADHVAFVGSRRKFAALADKLAAKGLADTARVKAPAGLDIGAVTSEEIALSILAELIQLRRQSVRAEDSA